MDCTRRQILVSGMAKAACIFLLSITAFGCPTRSSVAGRMNVYVREEEPLPFDSEVEYLEGTGSQWIDTGIVPNSSIGFILIAAFTDHSVGYNRLFGAQKDGYSSTIVVRQYEPSSGDILIQKYGGVGGVVQLVGFDVEKHIFRFNYPDNSCSVDDIKWTYTSFSDSFTGSCWLWGNNNVASGFAKARIYRLIVFSRSDGRIVAEFIPCRIGDHGCMYELVTGRFFENNGTGEFVIGPDV